MAPVTKGGTRTSVRKSPLRKKKLLLNISDLDGPTWVKTDKQAKKNKSNKNIYIYIYKQKQTIEKTGENGGKQKTGNIISP